MTVNSLIIKQLEDRGWVEVIGHRETVGRPALLAPRDSSWMTWGCLLSTVPALEESSVQERLWRAFRKTRPCPGLIARVWLNPPPTLPAPQSRQLCWKTPADVTTRPPTHY